MKISNEIIKIINVNYSKVDNAYLIKLINSFNFNHEICFVMYDLTYKKFIYSNTIINKIFGVNPNEFFTYNYLFLKKICHPLDFANLINEIATLMYISDYTKNNIVKSENKKQILRVKNKNGIWNENKINLIYLNGCGDDTFKVLLGFIYKNGTDNRAFTTKVTSREKEIFKLLSTGYSSKMIAHTLDISINTVITHRKNLIHKLNACNSAEMIKKGYELNLHS